VIVSGGKNLALQIEAAPSDLLPLVKAKTAENTFS
jgi:hypothetical protein